MTTATLPGLSQAYALSPAQSASFQRDGHIRLQGVAAPEVLSAYRPLFRAAIEERFGKRVDTSREDRSQRPFMQITNLWPHEAGVRAFTFARRFAQLAADLLGVEAVRLYQDLVFFKEPGGGQTPWHQDNVYSPLDTGRTITMWLPLVDVSVEMGALVFASASHAHGSLGSFKISQEGQAHYARLIEQRGYRLSTAALNAGDATFHSGWTLHHASANKTPHMREAVALIYFEDGARIAPEDDSNRLGDRIYFPGCAPGALAASALNPVLYRRS